MGIRAPLLPAASPGGRHRARTSRAPPARLERPRRTAGRGTSGCASPLARCWASEPACASLRSGGPRGEGELGSTPEGDGLASSELAGPRGGRTGPGSVGQRGRAARCAGLAAATGPAAHSGPRNSEVRAAVSPSCTPGPALSAGKRRSSGLHEVTRVLWDVPTVSRECDLQSGPR